MGFIRRRDRRRRAIAKRLDLDDQWRQGLDKIADIVRAKGELDEIVGAFRKTFHAAFMFGHEPDTIACYLTSAHNIDDEQAERVAYIYAIVDQIIAGMDP